MIIKVKDNKIFIHLCCRSGSRNKKLIKFPLRYRLPPIDFRVFTFMEHYKNLNLEDIVYTDDNGVTCVEQWKDIPDYEGYYQISNLGRVKSLEKTLIIRGRKCVYKALMKKNGIGKRGYWETSIYKNGKGCRTKIHRLIAISFIDNPKNHPQVNHIDGNRLNNKISNLEWVNNRENSCHRFKSSNLTSKYTGVSYFKRNNKWRSSIQVNGVSIRFGMFNTEEEAYEKRLEYEKENGIENKYL